MILTLKTMVRAPTVIKATTIYKKYKNELENKLKPLTRPKT